MKKILFLGRKPVAAKALTWISERQDVSVVGVVTDSHLSISPTRDLAITLGVPVYTKDDVEALISKSQIEYDIGISVLFWQKISRSIIDKSNFGVINFHPAPLPDYKGTAGYNVAVLNGHKKWAVSAHYINEEFDEGEIIDVSFFNIDYESETAYSLEKKTQIYLFEQFKKVISSALSIDRFLPTTPNSGGKYISRKEMEKMKEICPGDDIERKIRAFWFPPYDGAYIILNGIKCTLVHRKILNTLGDPTSSSLFTNNA